MSSEANPMLKTSCPKEKVKKYYGTKRGHLTRFLAHAKNRANKKQLPCNITLDYLESIATDVCPIFGTPFVWGRNRGKLGIEGATLDRIIPELGYIVGNVVFISDKANRIKAEFTENELYKVADWLHDKRKEILNAFKGQSAPLSDNHIEKSQNDSAFGVVLGTGIGEDCDGSHHHRGEPKGENSCDSTKESCRICMGSGSKQMEALELFKGRDDYGLTESEIKSIAKLFGCVCHQC